MGTNMARLPHAVPFVGTRVEIYLYFYGVSVVPPESWGNVG